MQGRSQNLDIGLSFLLICTTKKIFPMNPVVEYSKQLERARRDYRTQQERASEEYTVKVKDIVSDILDYLNSYYPFKGDYFNQLKQTVFYQLDVVLHRRRDLSHQALTDICRNGNIDWFAEPFFGVRKLKLSKLLHEYDDYRYERAGPTSDCYAYFEINQTSHGNDDARSADSRSDRCPRDDDDENSFSRGSDGDFKRKRTEA